MTEGGGLLSLGHRLVHTLGEEWGYNSLLALGTVGIMVISTNGKWRKLAQYLMWGAYRDIQNECDGMSTLQRGHQPQDRAHPTTGDGDTDTGHRRGARNGVRVRGGACTRHHSRTIAQLHTVATWHAPGVVYMTGSGESKTLHVSGKGD